MGVLDRSMEVIVGLAILFSHALLAVAAIVFLQWLLANPPGLVPLVVMFLGSTVIGGYVAYRVGSLQLVASIDATELPRQRAPELYRRLERLCHYSPITQPRLLVADLGAPNALSIGGPRSGFVVFDRRLFTLLTIDELEGILAHELAHIERRDTFWNTIAITAARILVGLVIAFLFPVVVLLVGIERGSAWIVGQPDREQIGLAGFLHQAVLILVGSVLFVFTLAFYAYSRRQEYAADSRASELTGKPAALARALAKINRATNPRPGLLSLLYIHDEPESARKRWFSTHPPLDSRIDRLLEDANAGSQQYVYRLRPGQ
jgi:heat shock protein HtpX